MKGWLTFTIAMIASITENDHISVRNAIEAIREVDSSNR